jgi:hypothetical protein
MLIFVVYCSNNLIKFAMHGCQKSASISHKYILLVYFLFIFLLIYFQIEIFLSLYFRHHTNLFFISIYVCDPFSRAPHCWMMGRWDAEEGHRDPSRACICLVPVELTAQTHWDVHSGGFINWRSF